MTLAVPPSSIINHRYVLGASLGKGGMGDVFHAHDRLTGQTVALKRVYHGINLADAPDAAEELRLGLAREFAALASLRHPNIIHVLDYGFDEQRQPYYTMEFLEDARTLRDAAHTQPLSFQIDLLTQMLRALAYIHRRGILHRDLKPGNVLVIMRNNTPLVKVLDFGLAGEIDRSYGVSGTVPYLAPEAISGAQPVSIPADLYSVGVMIFEILTGHPPFANESINGLIQHILKTPVKLDIDSVPPAMRVILGRLLAKDPDDRYPNAEAVIHALGELIGAPIPVENKETRESFLQASRLVGRDGEMATLINALEAARDGMGSAWLIGGESGVGKSRLLTELETHAQVSGARVLRGYVSDMGGAPFELWVDPLRHLLLGAEVSGFELSVLKAIVPDIDTLVTVADAGSSAATLGGEAARQRFVAIAIDLFRRAEGMIVLLLEDLHWGLESLELLRQLINAHLPLLIVGSYRDDEKPELPDSLPGATPIFLERLNADEIAALSESMLGATGGKQEIVQLLQRETEGNVYFLVETVRALAEEAGELGHIGRQTVPRVVLTGGMQAIVRRRLARVPEWGQPLLKLVAVAGRQLDLELLAQLGQLVEIDDIEPWIEATINAAVGEVQADEWRFAHDKLRQAMQDDLGATEKRLLHRQAARAVETVYPNPDVYAEDLFYHWREAGDRERELHYLFMATDRALNLTAVYSNALRWLQDSLNRYDAELEPSRRGKILVLLGKAHQLLAEYPAARERYAAALALSLDDLAAEARLGLAEIERRTGEPPTAVAYAREALRYYRSINDRRGIAEALMTQGAIHTDKGEYDSARAVLTDALMLLTELNEQVGIALAHNMLGNLGLYLGEYATAQGHYERALNLRTALGDLRGMSATLNNLSLIAQDRADYDAAWAYQEQSLAIKQRINDRQGIEVSLSNLGYLAQLQGDLQQTERMYLEALALQREIGDKRGISTTLTDLGTVAMNKDEDDIAELYFGESVRLKAEVEDRQGEAVYLNNYGSFLTVRGHFREARHLFERALQLGRAIGEPYLEFYSLMQLGELDELDSQFAPALAKYNQAFAICADIGLPRERGIILLDLARTHSAAGDRAAAESALREAVESVIQLRVTADQVKPLLVAAHMAVDQGDMARALALLGCLEAATITERVDRFALEILRGRIDAPARMTYDADYVRGSEWEIAAELHRLRDGV